MTKQLDRLKRLAAAAARDAAMPMPEDYRIHRLGKEMRAKLKAVFPATDFFIATSDGFDTMYGEFPASVELRWNDEPSISALFEVLHDLIEERRKHFHFETVTAHGFTCRTCGGRHGATFYDRPSKCPGGGDGIDW